MSFREVYEHYRWDEVVASLEEVSNSDVERVLHQGRANTLSDFLILISPAAKNYLEALASISSRVTLQRFGKTMQMYAPLYVSNECQNICTYCGYSYHNKIERLTLDEEQIIEEAKAVRDLGFEHVLLVSGEANKKVGVDYFKKAIQLVRPYFSQISLEVQPLEEHEYQALHAEGLHAVLVYQETYHQSTYKAVHPKGKKSNFWYRLDTPDRLGRAGIHKIGLGALLGLTDWRTDAFFVALHLSYLRKKYWQTRYAISFPRLRPAQGVHDVAVLTDEKDLVQLICAFRLFDEFVELSLSTRESPYFRDNAVALGVTSMSAGSKTDPGGYAVHKQALKQFEIDDDRSPAEIEAMLSERGYEAVWKNWDSILQTREGLAL